VRLAREREKEKSPAKHVILQAMVDSQAQSSAYNPADNLQQFAI
jgi:hypothetical protein